MWPPITGEETSEILRACRIGDVTLLKCLRKHLGVIRLDAVRDARGASCMHYAARGGHIHVLTYLTQKGNMGYGLPPRTHVGATPLHDTAVLGQLLALQWLLRHTTCSLRDVDMEGCNALHLAARQSPWLEKFIDFNTSKRQTASNTFEKDFFKLLNNAVYGKSLENVRSRTDFHLVHDEKRLVKLTASPRMKQFFIYNENLVGVSMKKQNILLNRPIYVGFSVLDLSKFYMYNFHYNWAVINYGSNIKLCMTDTDSLLYSIKTDNVYDDMKRDLDLFDTSDYPTEHPCYSIKNKKVLGKFKDELNSKPIYEFVGLRAKCYSILDNEEHEKRVSKGVPRVAIKNQLCHTQYVDCLVNHIQKVTSAHTIRSIKHELFTQKISKLSLSPFDDKRYILDDGIHTYPYGHYKITRKRKADIVLPEEQTLPKTLKKDS